MFSSPGSKAAQRRRIKANTGLSVNASGYFVNGSPIYVLDSIVGSFNGSTTTFNLTQNSLPVTPVANQYLTVVLSGVQQSPGVSYSVSGNSVTFATAPFPGDTCFMTAVGALSASLPSAGQVILLDSIVSQFNGATVSFSLLSGGVAQTPGSPQNLLVVLGGVEQDPASAYTVAGSVITFSTAPATNEPCSIRMIGIQTSNVSYSYTVNTAVVNLLLNGNMDIWTRGSTLTVNTSSSTVNNSLVVSGNGYTADMWQVIPTGASVTVTPQAGRVNSYQAMQVNGAASQTGFTIKQRVEAQQAALAANQQMSVQAQVFNASGSTITPTLTIKYPNATDNWSASSILINANTLQACPNGVWTQVAFAFASNATANAGMEVAFNFTSLTATSQYIRFGEGALTITPNTANGQIGSALTYPMRILSDEIYACKRHALNFGAGGVGRFNNTTSASLAWQLFVPMRTVPQFGLVISNATFLEPGVAERAGNPPTLGSFGSGSAFGNKGGRADISAIAASTSNSMVIVEGNSDFLFAATEL
jgi:hypothetical protein